MTRSLLLTLTLAFLTGCGAATLPAKDEPRLRALLTPTPTEHKYETMAALMADEKSDTEDLITYGKAAEDSGQANADALQAIGVLLGITPKPQPVPPAKPKWMFWRKE